MAELGRPKEITDSMVSMTLRIDPAYYEKLTAFARRCGIRSVNSYSLFMLMRHVDQVEAAERELNAADIPAITDLNWPSA